MAVTARFIDNAAPGLDSSGQKLQRHHVAIDSEQASWIDFGGDGPPAHFYHANGFPLAVYQPFLKYLAAGLRIFGLELRAIWPRAGEPPRALDWSAYADDLIAFLDSRGSTPVIGIGHSMGATATIYAARKRPDLFKALVLIETAMVPRAMAAVLRFMPHWFVRRGQIIKNTLQSPSRWPSRAAFLEAYRSPRAFKRFDEETWHAMAEHAVRETSTGDVELVFTRAWEALNYSRPPNVLKQIAALRVPTIAIRGKPSMFLRDEIWKQWQALSPQTKFIALPEYGHLLPLEAPKVCAATVLSHLEQTPQT